MKMALLLSSNATWMYPKGVPYANLVNSLQIQAIDAGWIDVSFG